MKQGDTSIYFFGSFELNPDERLFLKGSQPIPLSPKAFDVLEMLVRNAGHLVEKEEFLSRIWDETIVEDANLARAIYTLRRTLGSGDDGDKYIQTVAKRGYRFVAQVEHQSKSRGEQKAKMTGPLPGRSFSVSKRSLILGVLVSILVLIPLFGFVLRSGTTARIAETRYSAENLNLKRITQSGNVYGYLISPDGQYFAYITLGDPQFGLVVRQMATGTLLNLVPPRKETSYWSVAFAPDNSFLYYILKEADVDYGNLYRIPLLGGESKQLIQYANGHLRISPDGKKLAFVRVDRESSVSHIITANVDGSEERIIHTNSDPDSGYYSLDWSPDGQKFVLAFMRQETEKQSWYIAEMPVEGGQERQIGEASVLRITGVLWLPDMTGFITNEVDEVSKLPQICYRSYPTGSRRRLTNDLNYYQGISMTKDGSTIASMQVSSERQISVGTNETGKPAVQITKGSDRHFDSIAWLDESRLVYDLDEDGTYGRYNIWSTKLDGSEIRQVTFGDGNNRQHTLSPDGRTIVYVSNPRGKSDLWAVGTDDGEPRRITDLPYNPFNPVFSADGLTIYFDTLLDGVLTIMSIPLAGGSPTKLVSGEISNWAISRDGRRLAYSTVGPVKSETRVVYLDGIGPQIELDNNPDTFLAFSPDGSALDFNTQIDGSKNVWRQPLRGGPSFEISHFETGRVHRFAWSPDAKILASIRTFPTHDAVMLTFEDPTAHRVEP